MGSLHEREASTVSAISTPSLKSRAMFRFGRDSGTCTMRQKRPGAPTTFSKVSALVHFLHKVLEDF